MTKIPWNSHAPPLNSLLLENDPRNLRHMDTEAIEIAHINGVYSLASFINHSCEPNLDVTYPSLHGDFLVLIANRDINPGEEITMSYNDNSDR